VRQVFVSLSIEADVAEKAVRGRPALPKHCVRNSFPISVVSVIRGQIIFSTINGYYAVSGEGAE
jgi:hypothetical protein